MLCTLARWNQRDGGRLAGDTERRRWPSASRAPACVASASRHPRCPLGSTAMLCGFGIFGFAPWVLLSFSNLQAYVFPQASLVFSQCFSKGSAPFTLSSWDGGDPAATCFVTVPRVPEALL